MHGMGEQPFVSIASICAVKCRKQLIHGKANEHESCEEEEEKKPEIVHGIHINDWRHPDAALLRPAHEQRATKPVSQVESESLESRVKALEQRLSERRVAPDEEL